MTETIAVFGGSFDPPHFGHVLIAAYCQAHRQIDRLLVVPTYEHPLGKQSRTAYDHRYAMIALAVGDLPRVEVSRIEEELGGASRTLRTIEELKVRRPDAAFRLVIGADLVTEAHRWHRYDRIVELAPPLVFGRRGFDSGDQGTIEVMDVSSTEVRSRLAQQKDVTHLVPGAVIDYIEAHHLYSGAT